MRHIYKHVHVHATVVASLLASFCSQQCLFPVVSVGTCGAMSVVKMRLCLESSVIPLQKQTLAFVDPYKLAEEADEVLAVSLVRLSATGELSWLHQGLGLPRRWWLQNHFRVPLIQEILGLVKDKKPQQGCQVLMPRKHKNLLPLQVRGKILWFENNSRCVSLALQQGREVEHLQWFMNELQKDIRNLAVEPEASDGPEDQAGPSHKKSKLKLSEEFENLVQESLEEIREHPQSLSAVYLTSKSSFRVSRKKDNGWKIIRVKGLKKKQPLNRQFSFAVKACSEFLESADPGAAASSNQQPQPAVPEEAGHAEVGPEVESGAW